MYSWRESRLSEETKQLLIASGLSRQQAESKTAEICAEIFMADDDKAMIAEAREQLRMINSQVQEVASEYHRVKEEIKAVGNAVEAIIAAENEYGKVEDSKAKDAIAVYAALLKMNDAIDDASGDQKIRGASYVVYALLGGEARSYNFSPNCDDSN